jgi:endonuclease VIII
MLGERHAKREAAGLDRNSAAEALEDQAERRPVQSMDGEPGRTPPGPARHRLAEQRNVGVVGAKDTLVDRLEQSPYGRRRRAGRRGSQSWHHLHPASLPRVPEGDSLARAARRLQVLVGQRVEVETPHPRAAVKQLAQRLDGRTLVAVEAAGKNLLLRFEEGLVLRSHLRMSGRWQVRPRGSKLVGRPWLVLRGAEREAVLWNGPVLELDDRAVRRLGPDILAEPPDLAAMVGNLRRDPRRRAIGDALLDQRLVAGIGNLWKAEALWEARVSPWCPVAEVSDEELRSVLGAAHELMTASVENGRQRRLVYKRAGHRCRRCGTPIEARGQGDANRTAYWCPVCQA